MDNIKNVENVNLKIIKEFDEFCRKIPYQTSYYLNDYIFIANRSSAIQNKLETNLLILDGIGRAELIKCDICGDRYCLGQIGDIVEICNTCITILNPKYTKWISKKFNNQCNITYYFYNHGIDIYEPINPEGLIKLDKTDRHIKDKLTKFSFIIVKLLENHTMYELINPFIYTRIDHNSGTLLYCSLCRNEFAKYQLYSHKYSSVFNIICVCESCYTKYNNTIYNKYRDILLNTLSIAYYNDIPTDIAIIIVLYRILVKEMDQSYKILRNDLIPKENSLIQCKTICIIKYIELENELIWLFEGSKEDIDMLYAEMNQYNEYIDTLWEMRIN